MKGIIASVHLMFIDDFINYGRVTKSSIFIIDLFLKKFQSWYQRVKETSD